MRKFFLTFILYGIGMGITSTVQADQFDKEKVALIRKIYQEKELEKYASSELKKAIKYAQYIINTYQPGECWVSDWGLLELVNGDGAEAAAQEYGGETLDSTIQNTLKITPLENNIFLISFKEIPNDPYNILGMSIDCPKGICQVNDIYQVTDNHIGQSQKEHLLAFTSDKNICTGINPLTGVSYR